MQNENGLQIKDFYDDIDYKQIIEMFPDLVSKILISNLKILRRIIINTEILRKTKC